jgi:hypothetical protein
MPNPKNQIKSFQQLPYRSVFAWRFAQSFVWLGGIAILYCLLFFPSTGIMLFWNILIPAAPALLVLFAGLWRNVCPLATTNLLPRHLGLSKRKKLSAKQTGILNLAAVLALYIIVPLRHIIFNTNALATGILIISATGVSITVGLFYEWKSAWCSGLCPIHPVEKLYGGNVLITAPNAHCDKCMNCVVPCPDSTPNINPGSSVKTIYHRLSSVLIIGGLPGFIWGWFHVADTTGVRTLNGLLTAYELPLTGLLTTLTIYMILSNITKHKFERKLTGFFAAAGVTCYYWYRLPALLGFGNLGRDGLLIDLGKTLPLWGIYCMMAASGCFFFFRLFIGSKNKKSWLKRPEFANFSSKKKSL